jgi:hypothetical protein
MLPGGAGREGMAGRGSGRVDLHDDRSGGAMTWIWSDFDPCVDRQELILVHDPGAMPQPGHGDPAGSSSSHEPDRRMDESSLAVDGSIRHATSVAPRSKRAGRPATRRGLKKGSSRYVARGYGPVKPSIRYPTPGSAWIKPAISPSGSAAASLCRIWLT